MHAVIRGGLLLRVVALDSNNPKARTLQQRDQLILSVPARNKGVELGLDDLAAALPL
jgi:hypothetical protein